MRVVENERQIAMNKPLNHFGQSDYKFEVRFPKGKGWNRAFDTRVEASNYGRHFFEKYGRTSRIIKVTSECVGVFGHET